MSQLRFSVTILNKLTGLQSIYVEQILMQPFNVYFRYMLLQVTVPLQCSALLKLAC